MSGSADRQLPWLEPGDPFPDPESAWGPEAPASGLLAAGGALDTASLRAAYAHGIFPWFSEGQPILWWSPDPRMVLRPADFRLHRSLRKTLQQFRLRPGADLRIDTAFDQVIRHCAQTPRAGQDGTWILPEMQAAYGALHRAGHAHSVEVWEDETLVGGLYCVAIGQAVFGESMFAHRTDASKIALAGLMAFCRHHGVAMVDCQQNTRHLASLGAAEISRSMFLDTVAQACARPALSWGFEPLYWASVLSTRQASA